MGIILTSPVFGEGDRIPVKFTCDGENVSPPLAWTGLPEGSETLALICDDPDSPSGTWVHWVLFNLPASATELGEGVRPDKQLASGARQGRNDFKKIGYGGPCPHGGTHRYYFRLYALSTTLSLAPGITKGELLKAMQGHILAEGQLMGKYRR